MEQRLHNETESLQTPSETYRSVPLSQETPPTQGQDPRQEQADALLAVLKEEGEKRRNRRPWILSGASIAFVLMVVLTIMKSLAAGKLRFESGLFALIFMLIAWAYSASQKHQEATRKAAELDDKRVVGPLTEALEFTSRGLGGGAERGNAINGLVRLLPTLRASDASLLDTEQRAILNRVLKGVSFQTGIAIQGARYGSWGVYGGFVVAGIRHAGWGRSRRRDIWHGRHTDLVLAILQAYEQIGDSAALPVVESLAEGKGPASKEPRIREAAERCLPALRILAQKEQEKQRLLRPAEAQGNASDRLLRPAQGSTTGDSQTLVRPSAASEQ